MSSNDARDAALWRDNVTKWAESLNRRVTVEQWMFDAASGKRPMPTAEQLREWAMKLGVGGDLKAAVAGAGGDAPAARLLNRQEIEAVVNAQPTYWGAIEAVVREFARVNGIALASGVNGPLKGGA